MSVNKYSKLTLTPEFHALVERYQTAHGYETLTQALYELIARGWNDWIGELDTRTNNTSAACWSVDEQTEKALFAEFDAEPDAPTHFHEWFAQRFAPRHGGKREGAGRKAVRS